MENTENFHKLIFWNVKIIYLNLELFLKDFVCSGHNSQSVAQSYPQNLALKLEGSFSCY